MLTITKDFAFDSSHRLNNKNWEMEKNKRTYGKCNEMHGHTYRLSVTLEGEVNEDGMLMNFSELKEIVEKNVLDLFDHKCLNDEYLLPTCENMVKDIFDKLYRPLSKSNCRLSRVDLYEQIYPTNSYASYQLEIC